MNHVKEPKNHQISKDITAKKIAFDNLSRPEEVFKAIAHLPWAMWLDSCNNTHVDSQFDIMVFQPLVTLETNGLETAVKSTINEFNFSSTQPPLDLIHTIQKSVFDQVTLPDTYLPFVGGALGYWAYDLSHRFETLPTSCIKDINLPEMSVGIYQQALIFDHNLNSFTLICLESERIALTDKLFKLIKSINKASTPFALSSPWQANMDKAQYIEKFKKVQAYLLSGDCYQINLAQRFKASYCGDEFTAYLKLRESNKAPFSAFLRFRQTSVLSISPERFLKLADGYVQTKPIKGTRPRASNTAQDAANADELLRSEKDRSENLMIVDLLRNDISKVCSPGTVKVPKLFDIESFPAVHHLVSTIQGKLDTNFKATDLLGGAFPGGSITGAPKIRAMEIIDELEPHQRSLYCGSIGYISACGNMDTSITIRTLICVDKNIYCWAGGGLVADSDAESEYQETFDKVAKILPVLS